MTEKYRRKGKELKKTRLFAHFFAFKLLKKLKKNVIIFRYIKQEYSKAAEKRSVYSFCRLPYLDKQEEILLAKKHQKQAKNKENKKESLLVTKESLCSTFALFALLATLILCTRSFIFGDFGVAVHSFLTGIFGYFAYVVILGVVYLSVMGLIGKRLVKNRAVGTCVALCVICFTLVLHTALTFNWARDGYLAKCFLAGETFPDTTVAGWLGGLIVFALSAVMSNIGAIVVFSLFGLFFAYLAYNFIKNPRVKKEKPIKEQKQTQQSVSETPTQPTESISPQYVRQGTYEGIAPMRQMPPTQNGGTGREIVMGEQNNGKVASYSPFGQVEQMQKRPEQPVRTPQDSREILFGGNPAENFRKNLLFDPNSGVNNRPIDPVQPTGEYIPSYTESYQNSINEETETKRPVYGSYSNPSSANNTQQPKEEYIEPMSYLEEEKPVRQEPVTYPSFEEELREPEPEKPTETFGFGRGEESVVEDKPYQRHDYMDLFSPSNPRLFEDSSSRVEDSVSERSLGREEVTETRDRFDVRGFAEEREEPIVEREERGGRGLDIFDEPEEDPYALRSEEPTRGISRGEEEIDISGRGSNNTPASYLGVTDRGASIPQPPRAEPVKEPEPQKPAKPRVIRPYKRVPLDDFDCRDVEPSANEIEVEQTKQDIIATLEDFKVTGATIASVTFGPTVTRYNVALPRSISPRKVVALDQSIAISLHSSGVNIYPNYEDGVVSIEVPNKERQFVQLGCMLSGNTFVNAPAGSLMFAMGKNVANAKIYGDISKMIHLLVAGSSGSGKSVFLGALIVSMIYKYSPEELRLILIDPKKTEFVLYNNLPHLMINEIITDVNKAVQSLNWAIGEMNRRYTLFEQMSRAGKYVVNLDQYNEQLEKNQRLPKIVIIIDELADLMLAAKKDIEDKIQNLTQKARAAGIHLIVATQRPSADVITGVIKSNLSTRIAFAVASEVDSRVILDQSGAQKLLGKGDFLYSMPGINTPVRVQSAFISPGDSQKVVNFIKANNEAYYDEEATAYINNTRASGDDSSSGDKGEIDPLSIEALRHVILSGSASISMIQRKCSAGYNRAGKIIEWMEDMGYISAFDGAKARKVLITKEEFESKYGPL